MMWPLLPVPLSLLHMPHPLPHDLCSNAPEVSTSSRCDQSEVKPKKERKVLTNPSNPGVCLYEFIYSWLTNAWTRQREEHDQNGSYLSAWLILGPQHFYSFHLCPFKRRECWWVFLQSKHYIWAQYKYQNKWSHTKLKVGSMNLKFLLFPGVQSHESRVFSRNPWLPCENTPHFVVDPIPGFSLGL